MDDGLHHQTGIQRLLDEGLHVVVHVLTDEDEFLHAVAILFVPVALQFGLGLEESFELVFRHGGIPLSAVLE